MLSPVALDLSDDGTVVGDPPIDAALITYRIKHYHATDGSFSIKGLPPGDYIVGALTDLETGEWNDPALLDQLSKAGVKVTLRDGETTRQDLSIGK